VTDFNALTFDNKDQQQHLRDYLAAAASSPDIQRMRAAGMALWDVGGAHRLLDAGCGNGEVARELAAAHPGAEVTAADFSPDAIAEAARRHDGSQVKYEVADVYDLPYEDGYFDGVRAERVFQHLLDPNRAVTELARVLRPGGRMCLIDPDWDTALVDGSPEAFNDYARTVFASQSELRPAGRSSMSSGRTLRRRMLHAGLTDIRLEPITVAHTELAALRLVLPMRRETPVSEALKPTFDAFFDDLEQAAADGTFLFTLTMWMVAGTKPQ